MSTSNPVQTVIERHSIELCGVKVYAQRNGTAVTGRVEFPGGESDRKPCPIDYRSNRPGGPLDPRVGIRSSGAVRTGLNLSEAALNGRLGTAEISHGADQHSDEAGT